MAFDTLPGIIEYGQNELANARVMIAFHQPQSHGLCRCGRVWECNVHAQYDAWRGYWEARLTWLKRKAGADDPTMLLPFVTPGQSRSIG